MRLVASVHQFGHYCKGKKKQNQNETIYVNLKFSLSTQNLHVDAKQSDQQSPELTFEKEVRVVLEGVV